MWRDVVRVFRSPPGARAEPSAVAAYAPARAGRAPRADVYLPAGAPDASVVLVHGGGFVLGSRRMPAVRQVSSALVAAGVGVCAIDYRLMFRGGRLAEALADVHAALAFWRARGAALGFDAARISLVGLSAGGTLALLAASEDPGLHRLACCFGVYQLDAYAGLWPRLLVRSADPATWRARSPLAAPQPAVPTLLLHGDADRLVPVAQAHALAAHRDTLGLATKLVVYPGAPHGFFNLAGDAATAGARELVAHVTAP